MRRTVASDGSCRLCHGVFPYRQIENHLRSCQRSQTSSGTSEVLLLRAEAFPFWIYFEAEAHLPLKKIDQFLRDLWMECCGHLSAFTIDGTRYTSYDDELEYDERSMKVPFEKVIQLGVPFSYEYDFGTTSEISLAYLSSRQGSRGISVVARNNPPSFSCKICRQPAAEICALCSWEGGIFCAPCAKKHRCGDGGDYLLPIVNSPRSGLCGFTGDDCTLLDA